MSVGYDINHDEGLVTITGTSNVTIEQACELGRKLLADADLDRSLPHLIDLRGLNVDRTQAESLAFKEFVLSEYSPSVRGSIAIVIDESLDDKSCAALFHLSCSIEKAELFDHYDQALRWLMRREFA